MYEKANNTNTLYNVRLAGNFCSPLYIYGDVNRQQFLVSIIVAYLYIYSVYYIFRISAGYYTYVFLNLIMQSSNF